MPRPRILRSPRSQQRNQAARKNPRKIPSKIVTIGDREDCEIIKLDDTDDDFLDSKFFEPHTQLRTQPEVDTESRPRKSSVSSTKLPVHRLAKESSGKLKNHQKSVCEPQNSEKLIPLDSAQSRVLYPTSYSIQSSEKMVKASRDEKKMLNNSRENVIRATIPRDSVETHKISSEMETLTSGITKADGENVMGAVSTVSVSDSSKSDKLIILARERDNCGGNIGEKSEVSSFSTTESRGSRYSTIPTLEITIDKINQAKNEKILNSERKRPSDGVLSFECSKKSIRLTTRNLDVACSSKTRASSSLSTASNSKNIQTPVSEVTATSTKSYKSDDPRRVRCIACKKSFKNREELHRHATLSHSDIQFLFCELCNETFLTYGDLQSHRAQVCGSENAEIVETIVIEDSEEFTPTVESPKKEKEQEIAPVKSKIVVPGIAPRKRGRPRKIRPLSPAARHKYAEKEVLSHATVATRQELAKAKIKKLIVPLTRLESATLEKYLNKRAKRPVADTGANPDEKHGNQRKRRRRKRPNYNRVGNIRRIARKKPIVTIKRDSIDETIDEIIRRYRKSARWRKSAFERDEWSADVGTDESSKMDNRKRGKISWSRTAQRSAIRYTRRQSLYERSDESTNNKIARKEFDPGQFEEVAISSSDDSDVFGGKYWRRMLNGRQGKLKNSREQQTYRPSKRKSVSASKQQSEMTNYELCMMCRELYTLMRQLTTLFVDNSAKNIPVKCPLCNLYFISMSYLRKHIASYHLQCKNKIPCKIATSLLIARSLRVDTALEFETDDNLPIECRQCSTKFGDEKELIDHIFTRHDVPMSHQEQPSIEAPFYVEDLPSSCLETCKKQLKDQSTVGRFPEICAQEPLSEQIDENSAMSSEKLVLVCALCGANFAESTDYVRHLKSEHNSTSSAVTESLRPSYDSSEPNVPSSLDEAKIFDNEKMSSIPKSKLEDQTSVDRDYLLKQLLSEKQERNENPDGCQDLKCQSPERYFMKTPKLSLLNFAHDFEMTRLMKNESSTVESDTNALFADSPQDFWRDTELASSPPVALTAEESVSCAPTSEPISIKEDIFISEDEYAHIDFLERRMSTDRETIESTTTKQPRNENTEVSRDRSKPESNTKKQPKATKRGNEKFQVLKELLNSEKETQNPQITTQPEKEKLGAFRVLETGEALSNPEKSSPRLPIECTKCNRKFPNQASLNEHLFFLHDDRLKDSILTDVLETNSPNINEANETRCEICSQTFKFPQHYSRHRYFAHGDHELVHICENCGKILTTVTMVNVHICTDVASYNCRACGETFATGMLLRLHNMYKHMETEGPHFCQPCNKTFLTKAMLGWHERSEHRSFRPYRPRAASPVEMALSSPVSVEHEMEYEFTGQLDAPRVGSKSEGNFERRNRVGMKKGPKTYVSRKTRPEAFVTYVDEREILQCDLCRLYCLSKAALRSHKAKNHSKLVDMCRVCDKPYVRGKLLRHMIKRHVSPCDSYRCERESIWKLQDNVDESDARDLVMLLGATRLISLCEYQRFADSQTKRVQCPSCGLQVKNSGAYKRHFFARHDTMCALCNIEFKSGDKAALHKIEDHGSAESYLWFADQTVVALTAAANFSKVAEESFIAMISRESDRSDEGDDSDAHEGENSNVEDEDQWMDGGKVAGEGKKSGNSTGYLVNWDGDENLARNPQESDGNSSPFQNLREQDESKIIVVVTDEDLEEYGIGTGNPNFWGLAAKISSTSGDLTPRDVKAMLDSCFGR